MVSKNVLLMREILRKFQEYVYVVYGIIDRPLWLANPFPDLNPLFSSLISALEQLEKGHVSLKITFSKKGWMLTLTGGSQSRKL